MIMGKTNNNLRKDKSNKKHEAFVPRKRFVMNYEDDSDLHGNDSLRKRKST